MYKTIATLLFLTLGSLEARVLSVPAGYSTIQAGLNAAAAGDTVAVQSGVYAPVFVSGKNSICLLGLNNPKIGRGSTVTDTAAIKIVNGRRWVIQGFETESTHIGIHLYRCTTMTVTRNHVHDHILGYNAIGISLENSDSILVSHNLLVRNEFAGIEPLYASHTRVIRNTIVKTRNYEGLLVTGRSSEDVDAIGNIFYQNSGNGIEFRSDLYPSGKIRYNLFRENSQTPLCNNCTLDSTNLTALDPLFVNAAADNYNLTPGSPAVDAGDPAAPVDPDGSRADIGAFYVHQAPQPLLIPVPTPTLIRKPAFRWHRLPDVTDYTIRIDTTPLFTSPLVNLATNDTFFVPLANLPITTVYWQVGAGTPIRYSTIGSFTIQDSTIPVLIPFQPNPTQDRTPTLQWRRVPGATEYHLVIAHDSGFAVTDVSIAVSDTFFTPLTNLAFGTIFWKVNSSLNAKYSPWNRFVIQADTIPFLYAFNGSSTSNRRPQFRWRPVTRAASYRIQIDTVKSFAAPLTTLNVSDTAFTPLSNLGDGRYFWRVSCDLNPAAYSMTDSLNIGATGAELINPALTVGGISVSPNPFLPATTIVFSNPGRLASLVIHDARGRTVARFDRLTGDRMTWNAAGYPSGVYIISVSSGNSRWHRRVCLTK